MRRASGSVLMLRAVRVRVKFVVSVSGMSTVRVNVWVRVRVSNLLGSD